ncbi:MAG: 2-amino-3,7-dideoxy-D-threo-hept-6-ulosonate synthase [Desulfovibrionaceae bacterium]
MLGKQLRMKRLFSFSSKKSILLPLDHGVSLGPIKGLENVYTCVARFAATGNINAVIGHRRVLHALAQESVPIIGGILHISGSTSFSQPNNKAIVASVEDALCLGADAISIHINLGEEYEYAMLTALGKLLQEASRYSLPVVAMVYVRKENETSFREEDIIHSARVVDDMGVDIIKVPYTGSIESFSQVVQSCCAPVIIAGGALNTPESTLEAIYSSIQAGGRGISIGRNIFGAEYPEVLLEVIHTVVHRGLFLEKALTLYYSMVERYKRRG